MAVLNTIQMTQAEDREIVELKEELGLSSKKAVVLEGIHLLKKSLIEQKRIQTLKNASIKVRKASKKENQEWSKLSSALQST